VSRLASSTTPLVVPKKERVLRAALVGTQFVGVAMMRYIWRIEPLASLPREDVAALITPVIEHYLNEKLSSSFTAKQPTSCVASGRAGEHRCDGFDVQGDGAAKIRSLDRGAGALPCVDRHLRGMSERIVALHGRRQSPGGRRKQMRVSKPKPSHGDLP
jgi:hypothetical protein